MARVMTKIEELRKQVLDDAQDMVHFLPIMDPAPGTLRERAERLVELAKLLEAEIAAR